MYIQNQLLAKKGPPIPVDLENEKEAYDFIELCLEPDLGERPSAKELLNHPYPRVRTGKKTLLFYFYFYFYSLDC